MAVVGANPFAAVLFPFTGRRFHPSTETLRPVPRTVSPSRRSALSTAQQSSAPASPAPDRTAGSNGEKVLKKNSKTLEFVGELNRFAPSLDKEGDFELRESSVNDYFEQAAVLAKSTGDGGGPRWFSPVDCGWPRLTGAPLLLYLPGIDGVGLGLMRQHLKLSRIFEIWCLHIPVKDRTPFTELVKLVEGTVQSEYSQSLQRPIYLVGESLGGCLALAVASSNPEIDLVLVLANPATSFSKSPLQLFSTPQMQLLVSLLESMPNQPFPISPFVLSPLKGDYVAPLVDAVEQCLGHSKAAKDILQGLRSLASYYSVIADILPIHTFLWKMEMLKNGSAYANSCLHATKAHTLLLTSGRDTLLPSQEEGERLRHVLPKCEIRRWR